MTEYSDKLFDLLFEISNEDRYNILKQLLSEDANLTQISNALRLKISETRRHLSRLTSVGIAIRNPDGSYRLTNFGIQILIQIDNIKFLTENDKYFETHTVKNIPPEFQGRFSNLSESKYLDNIIGFIHRIEQVIRESENEVWMLVEQFPLNLLSVINEALERGVTFKIIEPFNRVINPDIEALTTKVNLALDHMKITPLVEQKTLDEVDVFLYISEKDGVLAFPTLRGENDYKGFSLDGEQSKKWTRNLFQHYWDLASQRIPSISKISTDTEYCEDEGSNGKVVIIGRERPEYDAQAIQVAVDHYNEVVLKGRFNLGTNNIIIKRSVVIRGEGRVSGIPDTKIYKSGWNFPFVDVSLIGVFRIRGDDIDVVIENIHIENFNGTCIGTVSGNSLVLRKNRITLYSAWGRGLSFGRWGDHVVGIVAGETYLEGGFPGGIIIEDNYLDFALSYESGGFISHDGREREPGYRPDLFNHEAPVCVGLKISSNKGKVIVRNNIIKNMNSRGILVCDNRRTAEIKIHNNIIQSDVFGAYPYNSPMSGVGVLVQSAWSEPVSGSRVEVRGNKIICEKINYCGIAIHGPSYYQEGVGKLENCLVKDNIINLENGYIGIQIRKTDSTIIENNTISGKAYYGFQISGTQKRGEIDLSANSNIIRENKLDKLIIKEKDDYSDANINGYTFTGDKGNSKTAHIWLDPYTSNNTIILKGDKIIIDEGKNNNINIK
jgi:predicted transcriptional regulator